MSVFESVFEWPMMIEARQAERAGGLRRLTKESSTTTTLFLCSPGQADSAQRAAGGEVMLCAKRARVLC